MKNSTNHELEPGVIPMLRLFIGFRTGMVTLQAISIFLFERSEFFSFNLGWLGVVIFFDTFFLFAYLFSSWLKIKMGRFYLPLALLITTVGPILESYIVQSGSNMDVLPILAEPFVYLFIPLVLIAWQYKFRHILFYSLVTAIFEGGLNHFLQHTDMIILARIGILIVRTVTFLIVGYMVSQLVKVQRDQRKELTTTNRELAQANLKLVQHAETIEQLSTSRERNRLARELHDTLAHTLSGLAVQLDGVVTIWESNPQKAHHMVRESLSVARSGLDETRRALQNLRSTSLEELGLSLSLRLLAEDFAERLNLNLELEIPEQISDLSPDIEQGFYRIGQEALLNIQKHAQAACFTVLLKQENGSLLMSVKDDGKGFELKGINSEERFGIRGMRERAEILGAEFEIKSIISGGTEIIVKLEHK